MEMIDLEGLFERAMSVDPDEALRLAMETKETEEKRFYTFIADLTLQRRAYLEFRAVLEKNEPSDSDDKKWEE